MEKPETRCIECGGFVHSLNEDETGHPCMACAGRLLETLPGIFHSPWTTSRGAETPSEPASEEAAELESGSSEPPAPEWWRVEDDIVIGPDQPA